MLIDVSISGARSKRPENGKAGAERFGGRADAHRQSVATIAAARWPPAECPATTKRRAESGDGDEEHRGADVCDDIGDRDLGAKPIAGEGDSVAAPVHAGGEVAEERRLPACASSRRG